ncbi:high affinity methionine permease [Phlyctema vagabunda]|uniref:High affinity methionine permease n=1 Tax=Phlyctema vagabunda TaxID=108571 RepID=A0ABR4PD78_9HELO
MTEHSDSKDVEVNVTGSVGGGGNVGSDVKVVGSLEFVHEYGGNESQPSYQEASGAPVENISSLGLEVTSFTAVFLNIGQMIGTGVFSTPASILKGVGSVGLSLVFWVLGFFIGAAQLGIYVELASFFPNRSGAEVVYLEQAYPRPKYLLPVMFAVQSVLLSFSSSNCIVMAKYLFATGGYVPSAWEQKGLAVACFTLVLVLVLFSTRLSLRVSNAVGVIKIITLVFISITGLVVLGGHTSVQDPTANFRNSFDSDIKTSGYGLSNALVKVNFAYAGYTNSFNVVNEVKNPIRTMKRTAPASLVVVAILYIMCNIAYFAAVSKKDIEGSDVLVASLFFEAVFGTKSAPKALNFLIALSAFGNLVSVIIGHSRIIRECGRQGVLPYPRIWASTRPFGTPLASYALKYALTVLMIVAPPAGDAFNFIVDLQSYPSNMFLAATTFGLILIRRNRAKLSVPRTEFRVWDAAIGFTLAVNLFLLAMPWYPPPSGRFGGDVSFWYATYCVTGIGIILVCVLYYIVWIYVLPHFGKYAIRQELVQLSGETSKFHRLVKVPIEDLTSWDAQHDPLGQKLLDSSTNSASRAVSTSSGNDIGEKRI